MKKSNTKVFKIIILILVIAIMAGITYYLFPLIKNLSTAEGQIAFKERVGDSGIFGGKTAEFDCNYKRCRGI